MALNFISKDQHEPSNQPEERAPFKGNAVFGPGTTNIYGVEGTQGAPRGAGGFPGPMADLGPYGETAFNDLMNGTVFPGGGGAAGGASSWKDWILDGLKAASGVAGIAGGEGADVTKNEWERIDIFDDQTRQDLFGAGAGAIQDRLAQLLGMGPISGRTANVGFKAAAGRQSVDRSGIGFALKPPREIEDDFLGRLSEMLGQQQTENANRRDNLFAATGRSSSDPAAMALAREEEASFAQTKGRETRRFKSDFLQSAIGAHRQADFLDTEMGERHAERTDVQRRFYDNLNANIDLQNRSLDIQDFGTRQQGIGQILSALSQMLNATPPEFLSSRTETSHRNSAGDKFAFGLQQFEGLLTRLFGFA